MKKLVSMAVLTAMLVAACGSGSNAVAATVDGTDITVGEVESLMNTDGATVTKEQFAQFLSYEIQWAVIFEAAETDYGITVTEEEIEAKATEIYEGAAAEGESREDFLAARGVTEEFLDNIAHQTVIDEQLREILREDVPEPTEEEMEEARALAARGLTNVCVSHILVDTQEEAQDIFTRLDAGEEFGALAAELSTDTGSGENNGILPCSPPDSYVPEFAEATLVAPTGEVYTEIVETQYGFHVIMVTDRTEPTDADLPDDAMLSEQITEQAVVAELEEWFLTALGDAEVEVDPAYGTWQANPPTVIPPVDESSTTTTLDDGATTTSIAEDTSTTGG
ncbi:MAG TPA: peptidylprolyl isomerase [Acidimicrobiia bacterium]|nr:peptidylprolyl isomerase [Acidimicrobiia bacterium]